MIVPPPVVPGATVGVVAPGGAVNPDALARGVAALEAMGYHVRLATHVLERRRYLAGPSEVRLADLVAMLRDPEIGAVFCARGGSGTSQVLPHLDPALVAAHPKLVVGYSDVSPLLGWVVERCGVVALHGPMVATDLAKGLTDRAAARLGALLAAPGAGWREPITDVLAAGAATGRLVGGCLSSLVALLGTPYAIETDGAVLFLEDVGEPLYRLDRLLTQLALSSRLTRVHGIVAGQLSRCGRGETDWRERFRQLLAAVAPPSAVVLEGLPFGHGAVNTPIPLGVEVEVDTVRGDVAWGGA